jgi:hypothetical protein
MKLPPDARRFLAAFVLLSTFFIGEFLLLHVRRVPEPAAVLNHLEIDVALSPAAGTAQVSALLQLEAPKGRDVRAIGLRMPPAARRVRVSDGAGRRLAGRLLPHRRTYVAGWPEAGGRAWFLQRYPEPRLDVGLPAGADWRHLRVEYELDGSLLTSPAALKPDRVLFLGSWLPMVEAAQGAPAPEFKFQLRATAPAGSHTLVSGALEGRETGGAGERSEWRSRAPAPEVWLASAPFEERRVERGGRWALVHTGPDRPSDLALQIGDDALAIEEALESWAGPLPGIEWRLATVDGLGSPARGRPPLVLLSGDLFRRPAVRPGSRAERRGWMAREMARAWTTPHPPAPGASALAEALGAVLAQIALSAPAEAPGADAAVFRDRLASRQRVEWMMRCRASAAEASPLPPLRPGGVPTPGLLASAKLPATLDTISSQIGERAFLDLSLRAGAEPLPQRLSRAAGGASLAALLTREWLPDLSVEEAAAAPGGGVRARVADHGRGSTPLRVLVRLETPQGSEHLQWVELAGGRSAEVNFPRAAAWRRIEIDPLRRIFQVEFANDALPRERNPWEALQRLWEARRWISRREYERAAEEAKRAAEADPAIGEAPYWAGFALVKLGRGREAIPWLERARDSALDSDVLAVETLYLLGQAHEAAGAPQSAGAFYRQVIDGDWTSFSFERARAALERLEAGPAEGG